VLPAPITISVRAGALLLGALLLGALLLGALLPGVLLLVPLLLQAIKATNITIANRIANTLFMSVLLLIMF